MKTPEWPGIATAVGIILIAMIAMDLSKWQPLAAALIALFGGLLAYKGAMAKVEVDHAENKREFLRRQLASYLKLAIAIEAFDPVVKTVETKLAFSEEEIGIPVRELKIAEPPEIEQAWENLDVFPRKIIRQIAVIRSSIRSIDDLLSEIPPDRVIKGDVAEKGTRFFMLHINVGAISDACGLIKDVLDPEIESLAPEMPEHERTLRLYGEPHILHD